MVERVEMPLWGWGYADHVRQLSPSAESQLDERLGLSDTASSPAAISEFVISPSRLSEGQIDRLARVVGGSSVSRDPVKRLLRSVGKSYPDLVRMRSGGAVMLPDAVVSPGSSEQVDELLRACVAESIAVVPFGGGTSVVGGVDPLLGSHSAVISLDLGSMVGLSNIDENSRIATFLPGTNGPQIEELLNPQGLTLGHFPQSFEFATVGGFVATRSAGQASTGYGRIDRNVVGLELVAPTGVAAFKSMPGSAAGPDLRQLLVGSEGTLGVITEASLSVAKLPDVTDDRGWFVKSFAAGRALLQDLEQAGCAPAVSRLSDEQETEVSLLMAGGGRLQSALSGYLRLRRVQGGCLMITGFEGSRQSVEAQLRAALPIINRHGAVAVGHGIGRAWRKGRYSGPYLRDVLMGRGLLVDTLETAAPWSDLDRLYNSVGSALRENLASFGGDPIVMCHVSHLYQSGASLYFTWIGRQPGVTAEEQIANWQKVKSAAGDGIVAGGGTITHHHAIGHDHAAWMESEVGSQGLALLRAAKLELDPAGIMNPGKLLP